MIEYNISYQHPHHHFIDFQMLVNCESETQINLQLPAWRPGRYTLQNFAKNIQYFCILDEEGKEIPFKKTSKDSWQVDVSETKHIEVCYNYYAFQMDAGGSWLDEHQLYINFITCGLIVKEKEAEAYRIKLDLPDNYKIACSLPPEEKNILIADNFDELVESPLIASETLQHNSYQVAGSEFHIWIQGNCTPDWGKITKDFKAFTEVQCEMFNGFPFPEYHFLIHILPHKYYHGVEHHKSTVIVLGPEEDFDTKDMYENLLGVSSHELFHVWNIKGIRPAEMQPYDYSKENYFKTGFIAEGVTTYYGDYLLARANAFSQKEYIKELNKIFKRHFDNFGRFNLSVADSSYDLWLDGYEKGIPARKSSIYVKGAMVALILDIQLRYYTKFSKNLDDVMRLLWEKFGKTEKGYTEEDYINTVNEVAGREMSDYFEECVYGVYPLEKTLDKWLDVIGCRVQKKNSSLYHEKAWGFKISESMKVSDIASEAAAKPLALGDEIIAVNGKKASKSNFAQLIKGQTDIDLTVFRQQYLKKVRLKSSEATYYYTFELEVENNEKYEKWIKNS